MVKGRGRERVRERVTVCVCLGVCERENDRAKERESVGDRGASGRERYRETKQRAGSREQLQSESDRKTPQGTIRALDRERNRDDAITLSGESRKRRCVPGA